MNVYLCGQKYFGQEALKLLLATRHRVVGVSAPRVTRDGRPDRLWALAEDRGLPLLEAGKLKEETLPADVDLIIAAHSHDFIGRRTRLKARIGAIGYHPSLLPLHRGRDAVRWVNKLRERITGGTVYWLNDTVDGGPIAAQDWCFVGLDETAEELWQHKLQPMGIRLFRQVLADIERGVLVQVPQERELATWEPALDQPPLYRPDLLMLGNGYIEGFTVVRERGALGGAPPRSSNDVPDDAYLAAV